MSGDTQMFATLILLYLVFRRCHSLTRSPFLPASLSLSRLVVPGSSPCSFPRVSIARKIKPSACHLRTHILRRTCAPRNTLSRHVLARLSITDVDIPDRPAEFSLRSRREVRRNVFTLAATAADVTHLRDNARNSQIRVIGYV